MTPETKVEAHIDPFFELPTITYTVVRQHLAPAQGRKLRKNSSGSDPHRNTVAAPHMLAQFEAYVDFRLVAVAAFEIATHVVASAERRQQSPRRIAVSDARVQLKGQGGTTPGLMIKGEGKFGERERIPVEQETWIESLVEARKDTARGIGEKIAVVVLERKTDSHVESAVIFALPKPWFLEMASVDIVESRKRPYIQGIGDTPHYAGFGLRVKILVARFVIVVDIIVVAYAPELGFDRRKINVVMDSGTVARHYVRALHAKFEKHARGSVGIYGDIRGRRHRISHIGAVKPCGNETYSEFGVGRIMRPPYNAEIERLVLFWFVGVVEIINNP